MEEKAERGAVMNSLKIRKRGEGPDPVDVMVGNKLRTIRTLRGLSQNKLAMAMGLSFQQLQKYEQGRNRVSASKLYHFASYFGVPVTEFYRGLDTPEGVLISPEQAEILNTWNRVLPQYREKINEIMDVMGRE